MPESASGGGCGVPGPGRCQVWGGGVSGPGGWCVRSGGVSGPGGVPGPGGSAWSGGRGIPASSEADPPVNRMNDRHL